MDDTENIQYFASNLNHKNKGINKEEFNSLRKKAKNLPENTFWFGDDLYNHLPFPIFSIDRRDKKTIRNWNLACVKYYNIPKKDYCKPDKYAIGDFFDYVFSQASSQLGKDVIDKQRHFYLERIKLKNSLSKNDVDTISVFMPKSSEGKDNFRDSNRILCAYFAVIDAQRILVIIIIAPIDNLLTKDELINYLNSTTL